MNQTLKTLAVCLSVSGCTCVAPQHPETTGRTEQHDLESAVVGDTYRLFVRLPPDYELSPERRYPVIVQLDANLELLEEFDVAAGFASDLEQRGELPPAIVVGVGYPYNAYEPGRGRLRDYTLPMKYPDELGASGGAVRFYEFLRTELGPWLETHFRVAGPRSRALSGHSLGGLFTAWAFTQHDVNAPLFTGFVAASPSLFFDRGGIYAHLNELGARKPPMPVALYLTAGELEGPVMGVYFDDFTSRLQAHDFTGLEFQARKYRTNHVGNVSPSIHDGLRFVFASGRLEAP